MLLAKQGTEESEAERKCENNDRYVQRETVGTVREVSSRAIRPTERAPILGRYTPTICMLGHERCEMGERVRVILKTAKQEKTINPDTRLHNDEMREKEAACKKSKGVNENVGRVMSGELVHR